MCTFDISSTTPPLQLTKRNIFTTINQFFSSYISLKNSYLMILMIWCLGDFPPTLAKQTHDLASSKCWLNTSLNILWTLDERWNSIVRLSKRFFNFDYLKKFLNTFEIFLDAYWVRYSQPFKSGSKGLVDVALSLRWSVKYLLIFLIKTPKISHHADVFLNTPLYVLCILLGCTVYFLLMMVNKCANLVRNAMSLIFLYLFLYYLYNFENNWKVL